MVRKQETFHEANEAASHPGADFGAGEGRTALPEGSQGVSSSSPGQVVPSGGLLHQGCPKPANGPAVRQSGSPYKGPDRAAAKNAGILAGRFGRGTLFNKRTPGMGAKERLFVSMGAIQHGAINV